MHHPGNLIIRTEADAETYKAVTSVGGSLIIHADASLDALTSVGGDLYIDAGTNVTMAALEKSRKGHLAGMKDASKRIAPKGIEDMTKFEYQVSQRSGVASNLTLNKFGKDGWELVSVTRVEHSRFPLVYIFKRETA